MTPEQLKASILQYAIQGKLVEQRPEEGTAEELYQKIQKVAKPNKKVIPITESEIPFDIPPSWRWCKFGEIVDYSMGKTPPRAEPIWWKDDIHWVSIADMSEYARVISTKEKVSFKAVEEKFGAISPQGTLIMSFKLTVGRTSILDIDAVHNEAIISIYPYMDNDDNLRNYLFYILPIVTQWGDSKNAIKGKTLNSKSIANLMIPLAPLNELHRIVVKIKELLPYVDRYASSYEKLEQFNAKFPEDMKKSILQYAIQGKLVEQQPEEGTGEELYQQIQAEKQRLIQEKKIKKEKPLVEITEEEIPFDIPESWKWVRLGSVVSVYGGKRIPAGRKLTIEDTGHVYIRVSDMRDGYVSTENLQFVPQDIYPSISRYIIGKEDVFITVAGTIGRVGKIPPELDGANLTENADRLVFSQLDQDWLIKCLQSSVVQSQIINATTKVGQPKLSIARIQNMVIPLPPFAEQKRIVAKIAELLPLCERLR